MEENEKIKAKPKSHFWSNVGKVAMAVVAVGVFVATNGKAGGRS